MLHEHLAPTQQTERAGQDDYSAAARTWIPLIEPGMLVAGVAGDVVGEVTEIRESDFLVDRSGSLGLAPDGHLSVPYERIHVMLADKMTLDLPSSQLDQYAVPPSTSAR